MTTLNRFARYAWGVLAFNLLVVLWGAYVRASGSGAGCGSHWPLCNGEVIPRPEHVEMLVELTHRATSGVAFLLVLGMLVWAFRAYPAGSTVRRGAAASMVLMVMEALLGAGLVLFELVAENRSAFRAFSMAAHLANTFLLLGAIALTAWWGSGGRRVRLRGQGTAGWILHGALLATLVVGVTGALTALGDTLFPKTALGLDLSLSGTRHFLERLRIVHPVVAVLTALYVFLAGWLIQRFRPDAATRRLAGAVGALWAVQLAAGALNVALLAPVWMQLVHLLVADLAWLALVLLSASALAVPGTRERTAEEAQAPAGALLSHPG
ncbi:MAG: COX15/CtaA family protein [Gemmatimonadota bacterium]|nr:COX15/CtaA family protein [Gemmatimonadota bacterium]